MHWGNGDNLIIMTHKLFELQLLLIIAKLRYGSCLDCFSFFDLWIVHVSFGSSKLWTCDMPRPDYWPNKHAVWSYKNRRYTIDDELKSWDAPMLFNSRSCKPQYVTSSILSNVNIAASWDHESARQYNLATNYALALALVENTRTKRSSSAADITELQPSSPQLLQTHSSWSNVSHYKSGETDYVRTTVGDIMN